MRRYYLRHALAMSFYSPALYRDAARNWRGFGLTYLAGVLFLGWLRTWIKMHVDITTYLDEAVPEIVKQVPPVRIAGGEALVDGPQPCVIHEPRSGQIIAVLDTTGQALPKEADTAPMVLTKTSLTVHRADNNETRVYELKQFDGLSLDQPSLGHWAGLFRKWYGWVLYPTIFVFVMVFRLIQVAFYAVVAAGLAKILQVQMSLGAFTRLAALAITPVLVLGTILEWAGAPLGWPGGFLLEMMYLLLAVHWNREPFQLNGAQGS